MLGRGDIATALRSCGALEEPTSAPEKAPAVTFDNEELEEEDEGGGSPDGSLYSQLVPPRRSTRVA